jgi:hypothetical protein
MSKLRFIQIVLNKILKCAISALSPGTGYLQFIWLLGLGQVAVKYGVGDIHLVKYIT